VIDDLSFFTFLIILVVNVSFLIKVSVFFFKLPSDLHMNLLEGKFNLIIAIINSQHLVSHAVKEGDLGHQTSEVVVTIILILSVCETALELYCFDFE